MRRMATATCLVMAAACALGLRAGEPRSFGKGVTLAEATSLEDVIARPTDFEGKTVRVEGYVTAVCKEMGCWMALAPSTAKGEKSLVVQAAEHGAMVFPVAAKGSRAAAEGVFRRVGSPESREAAAEHAKQTGDSGGETARWQIRATGAVVY